MSDRILIVDDDDNIQILLARLLTLEGIENVDVVSSGLEAGGVPRVDETVTRILGREYARSRRLAGL